MTTAIGTAPSTAALNARLRDVIDLHFDTSEGTPFWIDLAARLGIDPHRDIRSVEDLHLLGDLQPADLTLRPLVDYIPRRLRDWMHAMVIGQTGGTTGSGTWTAYLPDEFDEAFVTPFARAAAHAGFPTGEQWLFIGPSGPHIIGKAAPRIAQAMGSPEPFAVDFDPRWARKLPTDSMPRKRYTAHIVDQAMAVIESQRVGVLFGTPVVLVQLAQRMTDLQRMLIRGVHYGGMAVDAATLERLQDHAFPNAVHLSGYGNTLLGCALELGGDASRTLDYFPHGDRLLFETVDEAGRPVQSGTRGRVRVTRLDHSMLIVRLLERDEAELISPPSNAPQGMSLAGLREPRPPRQTHTQHTDGLY